MLVCRTLVTAVIDEEKDYQARNRELQGQADVLRHSLVGIQEKLTCFDDMKMELDQTKLRCHNSENDRASLQ